jgi:integrase
MAANIKLTATSIGSIKVPGNGAEIIVYDTEIPGFGVRVRKAGSRNFVFTYRFAGHNKRMTLGSAVKEAFPDIRKRVLELQAQVRLGKVPGAERDNNRAQAADTFKAISDRFLALYQTAVQPATYSETERYLLKTAGTLHSRPIATITRRDIAEVLSAAAAHVTKGNGGSVTANRCRAALSTLFSWAMKEGIVEQNPTIGTHMRAETKRARTLVDPETGAMPELVRVWKALDDSLFSDIVRLLILTGQRRDEIGGLRWPELDEGLTRIKLPETRTKNGIPHLVPLSEVARKIVARQHRIVGQDCVFAVRGQRGFTPWDACKKLLDTKLPGLDHWVLHDLRRSTATALSLICKQPPHVVEAVLNHQSGSKRGVAGIYNLNTYLPEKTAALTLWSEHLMSAVSGEPAKVVPLRA